MSRPPPTATRSRSSSPVDPTGRSFSERNRWLWVSWERSRRLGRRSPITCKEAVTTGHDALTLIDAFLGHSVRGSRQVVDAASDVEVSYRELARWAGVIADRLHARGVRGSDVVAVPGQLGVPFIATMLGVWATGAALHVTAPQASPTELARCKAQLAPAAFLTVPTATELAAATRTDARARSMAVPEGTAALVATSGTSGEPKFVPLTHANLMASFVALNAVRRLGPDDVLLTALPPFHVAGLNLSLGHALAAGAEVVTQSRFDASAYLDLIEQRRVTAVNLVPTMVRMLTHEQRARPRDLSSLRHVSCGAASLDARDAVQFQDCTGTRVLQGYGLTETSSITHHERESAEPSAGVGPPLHGTEQRIVYPETLFEVPAGADGELLVRGPQVARQYHGAPDADVFRPDGWFRTGDLGRIDVDGSLQIVGRLRDIIKYKGHQISPIGIERGISAHPLVRDVAVAGVPDPDAGEIPVAYVVSDRELSAEALMEWLRAHSPDHELPRGIRFIDEVPRNANGKVLRRLLTEHRSLS